MNVTTVSPISKKYSTTLKSNVISFNSEKSINKIDLPKATILIALLTVISGLFGLHTRNKIINEGFKQLQKYKSDVNIQELWVILTSKCQKLASEINILKNINSKKEFEQYLSKEPNFGVLMQAEYTLMKPDSNILKYTKLSSIPKTFIKESIKGGIAGTVILGLFYCVTAIKNKQA